MSEIKETYVYCDQHGAPHSLNKDGTCWCGCIEDAPDFGRHGTLLKSNNLEDAIKECKKLDLWIYKS